MRADCTGRNPDGTVEEYWPGMFMLFQSENNRNIKKDFGQAHDPRRSAAATMSASLDITEPGWWTLGMSFTSDGQVHYYASEGVDDLTADDYFMSSFPYSMKCMTFNNFFFNVANWDNGRTWSTQWVIDDPKIYVIPPQGQTVAQLVSRQEEAAAAEAADDAAAAAAASSRRRSDSAKSR